MKFFKQFSEESEGPPPNRSEIAKRKFADNRSRFTDIRKKQLDNQKSKNAAANNSDKATTSKFNTQTTKFNTVGAKKPEDKKKPRKPLLGIRKETE
jgi:ribosomal protein L14E/L6E/L27E